jgi:hypothetical protein
VSGFYNLDLERFIIIKKVIEVPNQDMNMNTKELMSALLGSYIANQYLKITSMLLTMHFKSNLINLIMPMISILKSDAD